MWITLYYNTCIHVYIDISSLYNYKIMITNTTNNEVSLEIPLLKSLLQNEGIAVKNEIKKSLSDKTVVGFYCTASSLVRTATTINNLQKLITDNDLPLIIRANENNTGFRVMIVEQVNTSIHSIQELKYNLSLASNYLNMAETCELEIKKGNDVDWWEEKKIECLTMYQTISKAI